MNLIKAKSKSNKKTLDTLGKIDDSHKEEIKGSKEKEVNKEFHKKFEETKVKPLSSIESSNQKIKELEEKIKSLELKEKNPQQTFELSNDRIDQTNKELEASKAKLEKELETSKIKQEQDIINLKTFWALDLFIKHELRKLGVIAIEEAMIFFHDADKKGAMISIPYNETEDENFNCFLGEKMSTLENKEYTACTLLFKSKYNQHQFGGVFVTSYKKDSCTFDAKDAKKGFASLLSDPRIDLPIEICEKVFSFPDSTL